MTCFEISSRHIASNLGKNGRDKKSGEKRLRKKWTIEKKPKEKWPTKITYNYMKSNFSDS